MANSLPGSLNYSISVPPKKQRTGASGEIKEGGDVEERAVNMGPVTSGSFIVVITERVCDRQIRKNCSIGIGGWEKLS